MNRVASSLPAPACSRPGLQLGFIFLFLFSRQSFVIANT